MDYEMSRHVQCIMILDVSRQIISLACMEISDVMSGSSDEHLKIVEEANLMFVWPATGIIC